MEETFVVNVIGNRCIIVKHVKMNNQVSRKRLTEKVSEKLCGLFIANNLYY